MAEKDSRAQCFPLEILCVYGTKQTGKPYLFGFYMVYLTYGWILPKMLLILGLPFYRDCCKRGRLT